QAQNRFAPMDFGAFYEIYPRIFPKNGSSCESPASSDEMKPFTVSSQQSVVRDCKAESRKRKAESS
ncbi:MAG: hypothetical protein ACYDH9_25470, partial [Limisphaerales bacterium]